MPINHTTLDSTTGVAQSEKCDTNFRMNDKDKKTGGCCSSPGSCACDGSCNDEICSASYLDISADQCASAYASLLCSQECADQMSELYAASTWTVEEDSTSPCTGQEWSP